MYRTPRCIQEGKSTKTEEKLNHIKQRNNLKTIVIFLTLHMYFLNKVVATFEKHIFLSQTDLTRTGIISNSYNEVFEA
jgi:hypothetical protein